MKISCTTVIAVALLCTALSLTVPAAHAQSLQMTWVDRSGKTIETVGPGGPYRGPDLAPDGRRFVVHRHEEMDASRNGGGDVWLFESGSGPGRRLAGDGSGKIENVMPLWSPDGTRIVFGSMRNGKGGLYMKRADGTGAEELLIESETMKVPMSWSPDGKYIVYWVSGNIQWILPLTGDRKPFQLSDGATSHAQISPDGKWVAFNTFVARPEIYIKPFPTGSGQVHVSKEGGVFPRWRGDGKELYFMSVAGSTGQMMAADITVNGSKIEAGVPRALFDSGYVNLNHPTNYHVFAVTRDGQRFLIPRPDATPGSDDPNARTLTLFDRQGKAVGTVGDRGYFNNVALSPDQTRVTLLRNDPLKGTTDVWVFDVATGKGTQITSNKREDGTRTPVWSPDGKQIAYIGSRSGADAIYRKASSGEGSEELVYKLNGAGITLQEWTPNYLMYYSQQLGGNIEFALPLTSDPKPIEVARSQFPMLAAHLSPDHRFVAFRSNESGKDQIWVRRFDPSGPTTDKWQVSTDGGTGPVFWRADGKELYYLSLDRSMMVVNVRAGSGFEFDAPRVLFKVPEAFPAGQGLGPLTSTSGNADRFLMAVPRTPPPTPPLPQITILNRQGKTVQTVGEPERYSDPTFSPDGSRVVARKSPETVGDIEIWTFDVATGKGNLVAKSNQITFSNMLWSPDGKQIFYVVNRPGGFGTIIRKAADGSGNEEELYRYTPGAPVNINDITPDGKFLTFDSGGVLLILPLAGGPAATRQAIEIARDEFFFFGGRFSPDGRSIAYLATETDRAELYLRPFDPVSGKLGESKLQLTKDGVSSIVSWRADGRELYYRKGDMNDSLTMAVAVSTAPRFQASTPQFLFRAAGAGGAKNINRDGQRFVFAVPK
jgi:Tol biopolymer transport system component